ncbi:MAG: ABC transporter permease [Bacilli bacterium]|nr:ABC transporter permease [Bacilli bacterium]
MTVFKTYFKILNKNKFIVILYTVILLVFGGFNMQTSEKSLNFTPTKPTIAIVNEDSNEGITKGLIDYLEQNTENSQIKDNLDDALFYQDIDYIIYIPKNYHEDFMNGKNPSINIKTSGNYSGEFANMLVKRYVSIADIYRESITNEEELVNTISETLNSQVEIEFTSKVDTNKVSRASFYFNFASYSILACLIYVICLIQAIFNNIDIRKRNIISSSNYKHNNRILLFSNIIYAFILWLFYLIMSFILIGKIMLSNYGLILALNSLLFTLCATTIAFFIGSIVSNKNAISGIVNVVALGSSFLCGAFVPVEFLPDSVLTIAHILPTYYYVNSNEILKNIEVFNFDTLKPIIINMLIIVGYICLFIIITNIVSKKKQKIG